jgi:hypothetical protein
MGVYVAQRKVSEDVSEVVAEPLSKLGSDAGGAGTERALVVAVLDKCEWRVDRSTGPNVVAVYGHKVTDDRAVGDGPATTRATLSGAARRPRAPRRASTPIPPGAAVQL